MPSIAKCSPADPGISVVVPVRNGARWLPEAIGAVARECAGRPHEILVVDDGSTDGSPAICRALPVPHLRVLAGRGRGAAAAINLGITQSAFPFVAQIDQDVIVLPGWLPALLGSMDDPRLGAAQGWYVTDRAAAPLARAMAMDLEQRYARLAGGATDHVCTGNVLWRRHAVMAAGLLDETLGYGYDNDLSYRMTAAGFGLRICPGARSLHRWRDGLWSYLRQQYGFGYGRLDLVWRHRTRLCGDAVSPAPMMAHPLVMAGAVALLGAAGAASLAGGRAGLLAGASLALVAALAVERAAAGVRALRQWRDPAALLFPPVHLLRDLAWVCAAACWCARRLARRSPQPSHSMRARAVECRVSMTAEEP